MSGALAWRPPASKGSSTGRTPGSSRRPSPDPPQDPGPGSCALGPRLPGHPGGPQPQQPPPLPQPRPGPRPGPPPHPRAPSAAAHRRQVRQPVPHPRRPGGAPLHSGLSGAASGPAAGFQWPRRCLSAPLSRPAAPSLRRRCHGNRAPALRMRDALTSPTPQRRLGRGGAWPGRGGARAGRGGEGQGRGGAGRPAASSSRCSRCVRGRGRLAEASGSVQRPRPGRRSAPSAPCRQASHLRQRTLQGDRVQATGRTRDAETRTAGRDHFGCAGADLPPPTSSL